MSEFNPRDYDGATFESEHEEAQPEEEETNAVTAAAARWRRSIAIAIRESEAA